MIPKLTIFAMLRSSFVSAARSLPSTSAAVAAWMSSPRANASRRFGSPETCPGLALAAGRQLELLEEDPSDLLRRAEHELLARELVRARLELLEPVGEPCGDLAHPVGVDLDARVLHRREHRGQRELDALVEID